MRFFKPLILLAIILLSVFGSYGQSSSELKRRKKALTQEIEFLNRSLRKTSSTKTLSLKEINALTAQIRLREEKINTINSEIKLLDSQISENTNTVYSLQSQLNRLKKEYASMVIFANRNRGAYHKLMFVFAAKDFNQAYSRLRYLSQFSKYRKRQAQYIKKTQNILEVKIVELDHNKKEKNNLLHDEELEKQTLGKEKQKKSSVLVTLSKKEKQLSQQLAAKKKESARLNRAIQNAIAREIEAARKREAARIAAAKALAAKKSTSSTSSSKTVSSTKTASKGSSVLASTPESAKLSSSFLGSRGHLPWPVARGSIVEGYGKHSYGVNVTLENNGIDIKTPAGASVRSVYSGEVSTVHDLGGNLAVLIRHGEYFTVYSNLKSVTVSRGQKVKVNQTIGTVLTDPADGSTQLHFEIRKGAAPMNPTGWLAR